MYHAAAAVTTPDTDQLPAYLLFHQAVAQAQLAAWLPRGRRMIVDVSGPRGPGAALAARAGHTVLRVIDGSPSIRGAADAPPASRRAAGADRAPPADGRAAGADRAPPAGGRAAGADQAPPAGGRAAGADQAGRSDGRGTSGEGRSRRSRGAAGGVPEASGKTPPGAVVPLIADPSRLSFLRDGCADAVIAEDRALSTQLAAEAMIAEIARVLRPGGRVLACVDSLMLGMSVLAGQHHWAHLVDLPHAEVVLVPWPDGTITRCYGPDQARELFSGAGLTVKSIRPRTMLGESVVNLVLRRAPRSLPSLVRAELAAKSDESMGTQLLISATKRR